MTGAGWMARSIAAAVLAAAVPGAVLAAQPFPLVGGTYCGPKGATIVIDTAKDQVRINNMVCSFPVIAADHLQSDLCSTPDGKSIEESFDFRVIGKAFQHDHAWYQRCGDVPTAPGG